MPNALHLPKRFPSLPLLRKQWEQEGVKGCKCDYTGEQLKPRWLRQQTGLGQSSMGGGRGRLGLPPLMTQASSGNSAASMSSAAGTGQASWPRGWPLVGLVKQPVVLKVTVFSSRGTFAPPFPRRPGGFWAPPLS